MTADLWSDYVDQLKMEMGLPEWDIIIESFTCADDAVCQIQCIPGRKVAHLRLGPHFYAATLDDQRQALCHELLHVVEEQSSIVVYNLKEVLGLQTFTVVWDTFVSSREYMVDHLADLIAPTLSPVPKELWA